MRRPSRLILLALLCCTAMPACASAGPARRGVSPAAPMAEDLVQRSALRGQMAPVCGTGTITDQARGATGFTVATGAYAAEFNDGRLLVTRRGAVGSLRISLLPGPDTLDLLAHVTARSIDHTPEGISVRLAARVSWASAAITLYTYRQCPGLLRWTAALAIRGAGAPADSMGTDLSYTDALGNRAATPAVTLYTGAAPAATGLTYLYDPDLASTLFYLADLTALNGLFRATNGTAVGGPFRDPRGGPGSLVGASAEGLGFSLPVGSLSNLPAGGPPTPLIDSYLLLAPDRPTTETAQAARFLDDLGTVYALIQRPVLQPADWRSLGRRTAHDLRGPDVLVPFAGQQYLRAYVSDRRAAPELITQLNVLAGTLAYEHTFGRSPDLDRLRSLLVAGLPAFYAPEYGSVVNNLPLPHGPAGGSESWYYIGDLIDLARVAADDHMARLLLLRSLPTAIALAHHVRYVFPRAITYHGWQGSGAPQADVAGGYAYLMLQAFDLTHERRYLAEAEAGVEHLAGYGFHLAYETHMTALAATAEARLYTITGERRYLDLSLLPLANLFAASWIWDCGYGTCANGYHTFFGLSPLPWSGYIAMMEQEQAWRALREYALLAGIQAPSSVRTLVAEFCRYSLSTLAYTLPPLLPKGVASAAPAEYSFVPRNRLDLYVPLEDLRDGAQPSGQIGQEIYGAGGPLTLGGLSATRLAPDLWLTSPYPMAVLPGASSVRLILAGTGSYRVTLRLEGAGMDRVKGIAIASGGIAPLQPCGGSLCFTATGGSTVSVQYR